MREKEREKKERQTLRVREPRGVYWVSGEYCKITTGSIPYITKKSHRGNSLSANGVSLGYLCPVRPGSKKNGWVKRAKN